MSHPYPPYPPFPPFPAYPPYAGAGGHVGGAPAGWPAPGGGGGAGGGGGSPPAPRPPAQVGRFTVAPISLAPIPGVHSGTGRHPAVKMLVETASVPGSAPLQFKSANVTVTTMLFQLQDGNGLANVVPNWVGVAIPDTAVDFTRAHLHFHPMPAQGGYKDTDYPTKSGKWPELFYYMERFGHQLDGAKRNQVVIMPFLTNAATDTGVFAENWHDIVTNVLNQARYAQLADGKPVSPLQVVVSSYSVGIVYSNAFRNTAAGLKPLMNEVWDFDGLLSSASNLSQNLKTTSDYRVTKYQQQDPTDAASFYLPKARWVNAPEPPVGTLDVHHAIRDFMFHHGATISAVG